MSRSNQIIEVEIEELGWRGDGLASLAGERVFVPGTLPGERVRIRPSGRRKDGLTAELVEILAPSPAREAAPCPHFLRCGGCAAQQLSAAENADWKRRKVLVELERRGIRDVPLRDAVTVEPASRRRATLAARKRRGTVTLGFNARESAAIEPISDCPILVPRLVALLPDLRDLAGALLREGETADFAVAALTGGVDLLLTIGRDPDLEAREQVAAFAATADVARVSWRRTTTADPEPMIQKGTVAALFGGVPVTPPPGSFLQPSEAGERALVNDVLAGLGAARRVADLFCGCGTFSLPLAAQGAGVDAFDADPPALAALDRAARSAKLTGRLSTVRRNLFRDPVPAAALAAYDGLVFDPPRAGAQAQAGEIAGSRVPIVVAVSCNPATFARDARRLLDGGYSVTELRIVDQFVWSHHVELIASFRR
ncbi:TRAM domain-containing protein [Rhodospirillaceae bacterium SYSU D60014]|uniref:class I SAM-dependent RNA methyltransferase n=1 Tax=Virgifigura deserti TaxID=2268457 RepID=UPI0013C4DE1C